MVKRNAHVRFDVPVQQLRPTVSMSSNGDSVSGMLTRTLSTSRSIGHSLGTTPSLQRRASTTW